MRFHESVLFECLREEKVGMIERLLSIYQTVQVGEAASPSSMGCLLSDRFS